MCPGCNPMCPGRKIFVREDREANAPTGGKGKGSGTGGCQVYVGNLPWETNWMNLKVDMGLRPRHIGLQPGRMRS